MGASTDQESMEKCESRGVKETEEPGTRWKNHMYKIQESFFLDKLSFFLINYEFAFPVISCDSAPEIIKIFLLNKIVEMSKIKWVY